MATLCVNVSEEEGYVELHGLILKVSSSFGKTLQGHCDNRQLCKQLCSEVDVSPILTQRDGLVITIGYPVARVVPSIFVRKRTLGIRSFRNLSIHFSCFLDILVESDICQIIRDMILTALLPQGGGIMTIGTISVIVGAILLVLLRLFVKDEDSSVQIKGLRGGDCDELFKEEAEFDRTWSSLPCNIFNRSNDD